MLAFSGFDKLVLFILRIEIPVRESVIDLDIHVRILLDQYRLSIFLVRPEKRLEPNRHLQLVVDKDTSQMVTEMFPWKGMDRHQLSKNKN